MSERHPPRWLERLVARALPAGLSRQGALGDLAEEFRRRSARSGAGALLWYAGQALSLLAYGLVRRSAAPTSNSRLLGDLRWAVRLMVRHPGFALGVVSVLGLGLGANAAVFSVVDGTFRNTSWWGEPERTVAVWPERRLSFGMLGLFQEEQTAYRTLGGYAPLAFAVGTADGGSESVNGVVLTPALFRELASQPFLGRALADDDARLGVTPVVVMGEALWRRSFGADPSLVGRTVSVGGAPVTVVGIQAAGARAPGGRAELWLPLVMDPRDDDYFRAQNLTAVGVLGDGADLDLARQELVAFTERLSQLFPAFYPPGFAEGQTSVVLAGETQRRLVATPLLLLFGGTALLLLVTALNVGNLLLGRAIGRRRELAVRAAIGAGRGRIIRQLLVEGAVLTLLAAAVGLASAAVGGPAIARLFVGEAVVVASAVTSPAVALFGLAAAVLSWSVLSGVPVMHFVRAPAVRLAVAGQGSGTRLQRGLVTAQAALATLLLVAATLLVSTVDHLRQVPLGFQPDGLLTLELSPPANRVENSQVARDFYDRLVARAAAVPGVRAVGLTGWLPLRAQAPSTPINLESAPVDPAQAASAPLHMVDPGFFEVMGIAPLEGRLLRTEDRASAPTAVVVNRTLAGQLWPEGSAVGQRIAIDPHAWTRWVTVVGVVPDVRSGDMTGPPAPALYVSLAESPARDVTLVVRAPGTGPDLIPALRRAVAETDPTVPVRSVLWMPEVVRSAYSVAWVVMGLLVVLAALATGLGVLGIYAVMAHHVAAHRRELGVRMALGAQPNDMVWAVVRSGLLLAGLGIVAGAGLALLATRYLESLLFEVSALAPQAYLVPALSLFVAAGLATALPALRAGRLPPTEVLRAE